MYTVLCVSEDSIVAIGLGLFAFVVSFIGIILAFKTRAEKADLMVDVDKKIEDKIEPIVSRLEKHEDAINKLVTKQEVIHTKVDNILDGQERLMNFMIKISDKLDSKKDK